MAAEVVYTNSNLNEQPILTQRTYSILVTTPYLAIVAIATLLLPAFALNATLPDIASLEVFPDEIVMTLGEPEQRFVVSGIDADGLRHDLTAAAIFDETSLVQLHEPGHLTSRQSGTGELQGVVGSIRFKIPLTIHPKAEAEPLGFVRDILPVLSRSGCNGGSCHAKPNGQNSFSLSVFASDPESDYREIVSDARGRRVFPGAPEMSLLLQKPTLALPHKGGQRLEPGSRFYNMIARWMRDGMLYRLPEEATLESVQFMPPVGRFPANSQHDVRVEARYSDGTSRDITKMVDYAVSDKELLTVNEDGKVSFSNQSGQGVVLARYLGQVGQLHITVPTQGQTNRNVDSEFVVRNFIDQHAADHFESLRLIPSSSCSDPVFLRRAFLDAIGRLPTIEETKSFLGDSDPDKRSRWIERILQDPAYGDFWANKWADLLRPNPDRVGVKSVFLLDRWLRDQFRANTPYDQFVRAIITHRGSNHGVGPGVIFRDRRTPTERSSIFSQLFLGVRMECARCHHHPFEKWSQGDFYQFAAYFGSLKQKGAGLSPPISAGTESFYSGSGGTVKHPITEQTMQPKAPDGPVHQNTQLDPRLPLMDWIVSRDNPYFGRAIVNRIWGNFFSRGFVNPVDDFRDSNPPVNEPLLKALAEYLVAEKFDLKKLMATIMNSSLYQLSSLPNDTNRTDTKNFSRFYRKRLPAETLLDAISDLTQVAETFDGLPPGSRAMETWSYKISSHFLDAFSRPNSSSDPPCERDEKSSVVQALHLMHSQDLQKKLAAPSGWVSQLATSSESNNVIVERLYLAAYSRYPGPSELEIALQVFPEEAGNRQEAIEDLLWALINSAEFVFNH